MPLAGYSTMKEREKSTKLVPGLVIKGVGFGQYQVALLHILLIFNLVSTIILEGLTGTSACEITC